jgi:hypothetical protein
MSIRSKWIEGFACIYGQVAPKIEGFLMRIYIYIHISNRVSML